MKNQFKSQYKLYWILAIIRILMVFIPQTGYIHPDEYFQSIEILSGHFFDIEIDKPWEFNTTFPIRSIGINYLTVGLSYKLLQICNVIANYFGQSILTPYAIVVFPRAFVCLLTFLVDYTLIKLCSNNNEKFRSKIIILASSYVITVYGTHTFSNVIEMILLSLLLYFVADSMTFSNTVIKQREYLNRRYNSSETAVERAKFHKLRLLLISDSFNNCFKISSIVVFGFFNRPTFLAFAICPVFFWLYRGIGFKSVSIMQFHYRMLGLLFSSIPSVLFFVIADSFFYGHLSLAEIEFLKIDINNFVFTPLNFLKYNMNPDNLAIHGLHPKWLHFLINLPLLFNVLVLCNFVYFSNMILRFFKGQWHYLPTVRSIKGLMTTTFLAPVFLLSLFSHQEPRFLIPLITPLVYLHAETILPEKEIALERRFSDKKSISNMNKQNFGKFNFCLNCWFLLNLLLTLFYGFMHQGGVYSVGVELRNELRATRNTNFYLITSHVYSLPRCLLQEKSTETVYVSSKTKYKLTSRVTLFQEGSKNLKEVIKNIEVLTTSENKNQRVYLAYPSSLDEDIYFYLMQSNQSLKFFDCKEYFPHLSVEAFPDLYNNVQSIYSSNFYMNDILNMFYNLKRLFSLKLCKAEKMDVN